MKKIPRGVVGAVAVGAAAAAGWCAMLRPRRNQPGWEKLQGVRYAHRGLHDAGAGIPENSMAAFRLAVEHGFGAELDVHLMADGNLAVVHDSDLTRVCGKKALIEDLTAGDLGEYPLQGTAEIIPLLEEVLAVFEGKAPLIIELKAEKGNANDLTDRVMEVLADYRGVYCIESFHPAVLLRLEKRYPEVLRGQLSQNFFRGSETGLLSWPSSVVMTYLLSTSLTRPDFIAYDVEARKNWSLRTACRLFHAQEVNWTIRTPQQLWSVKADGAMGIFEHFDPTRKKG